MLTIDIPRTHQTDSEMRYYARESGTGVLLVSIPGMPPFEGVVGRIVEAHYLKTGYLRVVVQLERASNVRMDIHAGTV